MKPRLSIVPAESEPARSKPASLEELLVASINEAETERQYGAKFVRSNSLPGDSSLDEIHWELLGVCRGWSR